MVPPKNVTLKYVELCSLLQISWYVPILIREAYKPKYIIHCVNCMHNGKERIAIMLLIARYILSKRKQSF